MLPSIEPGTRILAVRQGVFGLRLAKVGDVVVFVSPICFEMWLIKRVAGVSGDIVEVDGRRWPVGPGEMFVLSDNANATKADSRTFGPVVVEGSYRRVATFAQGSPG